MNQLAIETANQPSIHLTFDKVGDRWSHQWHCNVDDVSQTILSSVEGTADQNWPPSAPLQEVSHHTLESGDAILCVGMAGKCHWSASYSIESDILESDFVESSTFGNANAIKADLACLQKEDSTDAAFGSTYLIDSNCELVTCSSDRVELRTECRKSVVIEAMKSNDLTSAFELVDRTLLIKPLLISKSPTVATRWGFQIKVGS